MKFTKALLMINFSIKTELMQHQKDAVKKLQGIKVGALFMEMGTGKTLVSLELIRQRVCKIKRVVWICPISLKREIYSHIINHTDIDPRYINTFNSRTTNNADLSAPIHIVGLQSIGMSDREYLAFEKTVCEDTFVILDESSFIKNHRAKTTKRVTKVCRDSKYRLILNGTPISQGIEDLYSQMFFLHPRILGYWTFSAFSRNHIVYSEKFRGMISSRVGRSKINKKMTPYVFHIRKDQCVNLPSKNYSDRYVELTNSQKSLYDMAKKMFEFEILDEREDKSGVAVYKLFTRLRQISNGVTPSSMNSERLECEKHSELKDILRTNQSSHLVVWSDFRNSIEQIKTTLYSEKNVYFEYHGGLNPNDRSAELLKWKKQGGVLVANPACAGFGLTLNEADTFIFFNNSFKYSERIQAEDRNHRIGQNKSCNYISIWADCGIEERISSALSRKGNALEELKEDLERIKNNKGRLTKMMSVL